MALHVSCSFWLSYFHEWVDACCICGYSMHDCMVGHYIVPRMHVFMSVVFDIYEILLFSDWIFVVDGILASMVGLDVVNID